MEYVRQKCCFVDSNNHLQRNYRALLEYNNLCASFFLLPGLAFLCQNLVYILYPTKTRL